MKEKNVDKLIYTNKNIALSTIPFHNDVSCIKRFIPEGFPVHLAIHKVSNAENVEEYTKLHSHEIPEINILISDSDDLEYIVQLNDEVQNVKSNSSIWIPAGVNHSTNVIKGSGYYIAIRLDNNI